jgi:hypothetical protein
MAKLFFACILIVPDWQKKMGLPGNCRFCYMENKVGLMNPISPITSKVDTKSEGVS